MPLFGKEPPPQIRDDDLRNAIISLNNQSNQDTKEIVLSLTLLAWFLGGVTFFLSFFFMWPPFQNFVVGLIGGGV